MAKNRTIFSSSDEDMQSYYKKIWKHRAGVFGRYLVLLIIILGVVFGTRYYFNNRTFSKYAVVSTVERNDTVTTQYAEFGKNILKYSRDGVSYTDSKNNSIFSITYTMQDPILDLNNQTGVVADRNGNQIYIFDQTAQQGQIKTLLPIRSVSISEQGVVAVMEEDSDSMKLEVYSRAGELIGDGVFSLQDSGYPMQTSISADGTKIGITFAQIDGSTLNTCVAVYNFDNVGENYVDHLVFAKTFTDQAVPEIHYFDSRSFVTVGDGVLTCYDGSQIPEVTAEITIENEIRSVFYGEKRLGLVFEREKGGYSIQIYDYRGNLTSELDFDQKYDNIYLLDRDIVVCSSTEMSMYTLKGKECYTQTFENPVSEIFTTSSRERFTLIYNKETQLIKLQ